MCGTDAFCVIADGFRNTGGDNGNQCRRLFLCSIERFSKRFLSAEDCLAVLDIGDDDLRDAGKACVCHHRMKSGKHLMRTALRCVNDRDSVTDKCSYRKCSAKRTSAEAFFRDIFLQGLPAPQDSAGLVCGNRRLQESHPHSCGTHPPVLMWGRVR